MIRSVFKGIYPHSIWSYSGKSDSIFLTFDDGPHPETTLPLLDLLDQFNAKANFFLLGKQVEKYPHLFEEYSTRGHLVANHSHSHLNGWKHGSTTSLEDFERCEGVFQSTFYRPPYGKIYCKAAQQIAKTHQIVMWDFLVKDYTSRSSEQCLNIFKKRCKPGSIAVFHENDKSKEKIIKLVLGCLEHIHSKGWQCALLH